MGKIVELPLVVGTEQEVAIDGQQLRSETGAILLDPGFGNTGACMSGITFIDGERGILRYRGYPIEELATGAGFLEVAYLLIHGELPNEVEFSAFEDEVRHHTMLHENYRRFFDALPMDAHPMPTCAAAIGALSTFYQGDLAREDVHTHVIRLIAKIPTIVAYSYKHSIGQPPVYPRNDLGYAANFLHMMFSTPCEPYRVDPVQARALERLLILHADHEQNCSTSTVRLVGSSNANLYASIAAGISALWGPLHGGANQEVIEMLGRIEAEGGDADAYVARARQGGDKTRLMGFGHRVYKNFDPRAVLLKHSCNELRDTMDGRSSRLLDIAFRLEEIALEDEYFIRRKLYPNVDFYSGILYLMLGIPVNLFTAMFALGRMPGWIAHWLEMKQDTATRIGRPRQIYVGRTKRPYVPRPERF
jgi:citrate synthase